MRGIRNDDQSLSPVTPLAFSVVPNPLKCSHFKLIMDDVVWTSIGLRVLECDNKYYYYWSEYARE